MRGLRVGTSSIDSDEMDDWRNTQQAEASATNKQIGQLQEALRGLTARITPKPPGAMGGETEEHCKDCGMAPHREEVCPFLGPKNIMSLEKLAAHIKRQPTKEQAGVIQYILEQAWPRSNRMSRATVAQAALLKRLVGGGQSSK